MWFRFEGMMILPLFSNRIKFLLQCMILLYLITVCIWNTIQILRLSNWNYCRVVIIPLFSLSVQLTDSAPLKYSVTHHVTKWEIMNEKNSLYKTNRWRLLQLTTPILFSKVSDRFNEDHLSSCKRPVSHWNFDFLYSPTVGTDRFD